MRIQVDLIFRGVGVVLILKWNAIFINLGLASIICKVGLKLKMPHRLVRSSVTGYHFLSIGFAWLHIHTRSSVYWDSLFAQPEKAPMFTEGQESQIPQ